MKNYNTYLDKRYKSSFTKLVIIVLKNPIETKCVKFYEVNHIQNWFSRSYLIDKDLLEKLMVMKEI